MPTSNFRIISYDNLDVHTNTNFVTRERLVINTSINYEPGSLINDDRWRLSAVAEEANNHESSPHNCEASSPNCRDDSVP